MGENIWKDAFGQLNPDREKEQEIWQKIASKQDAIAGKESFARQPGRGRKSFCGLKGAFAVAVCLAIMVIGVVFRDMIQEQIAQAWSYISEQGGKEQEIEENITDYRMSVISGYAPQLIACNEKRVIFAESTGLAVYDRKRETVAAVVDLQQIGCNYFNGQRLETRILPKGTDLFIYNVKGDEPQGKGYRFDLSQCSGTKGEVLEAAEQADVTEEVQRLWNSRRKKRYCDTFDVFLSEGVNVNESKGLYSEYSLSWQDDAGAENISCLIIGGDGQDTGNYSQSLRLRTMVKGEGAVREEKLAVAVEQGAAERTDREPLPSYSLVSDNAVEQALVDFAVGHPKEFELGSKIGKSCEEEDGEGADEGNSLFVPTVRLYAEKKDGDSLRIYGQAGTASYLRIGITLYQFSAGCGLFCASLEKTQAGCRVKKIFRPGYGASYYEDMIGFCGGDEKWFRKNVFEKYDKDENRIWSKQRRQLKEFLERNQLELQVYE